MTLREASIEINAATRRRQETLRGYQAIGWFATHYSRLEKLPSIERIFRPASELNPEERRERAKSTMQRLAAAVGGKVVELKKA